VVCIETRHTKTRHTKAFLKAQVNKTDRNDACGIAQMMRVNLFRPVHVKTMTSQQRRALLTARKLLQEKAIAIENDIRGLLRTFGLKVGVIGPVGFDVRIRELVDGRLELAEIAAALLTSRQTLREEVSRLHRKVLAIVKDDSTCRRLMTVPGVGPVVALAFISTIDVPARFRRSKAVGAALGLTPVLKGSGESKRSGCVSLCGDGMMRTLLYEAAQVMLTRVKRWSWLKAWAMNVAKRGSLCKAIVALADAWPSSCIGCGAMGRSSAGPGMTLPRVPDPDDEVHTKEGAIKVPPSGEQVSFAGRRMRQGCAGTWLGVATRSDRCLDCLLHSPDPMLGRFESQSRREARPREGQSPAVRRTAWKALDFNPPNREVPALGGAGRA
jgi:transposase